MNSTNPYNTNTQEINYLAIGFTTLAIGLATALFLRLIQCCKAKPVVKTILQSSTNPIATPIEQRTTENENPQTTPTTTATDDNPEDLRASLDDILSLNQLLGQNYNLSNRNVFHKQCDERSKEILKMSKASNAPIALLQSYTNTIVSSQTSVGTLMQFCLIYNRLDDFLETYASELQKPSPSKETLANATHSIEEIRGHLFGTENLYQNIITKPEITIANLFLVPQLVKLLGWMQEGQNKFYLTEYHEDEIEKIQKQITDVIITIINNHEGKSNPLYAKDHQNSILRLDRTSYLNLKELFEYADNL